MSWHGIAAALCIASAGEPEVVEVQRFDAETLALAESSTLARFFLEGAVSVGWRQVAVRGNEAQYHEDVHLDDGPVLRELSLRGRALDPAASVRTFVLEANGVGDPATSVASRVETTLGRAIATYDRTSFSANTTSDLHAFDFTRERARLRLETPGEKRAGLELTWGHRDGLSLGTRSVDFGFVSGFPVRQRDDSLGVGADAELDVAGFDVRVDGGIERLDSRDRRELAERSPSDPTQIQTESFAADGHRTLTRAGMRARREMFGRRFVLDFGARIAATSGSDALDSFESGILFSADDPFERTTEGSTDISAQDVELDLGGRYALDDATAISARVLRTREQQRATLVRMSTLVELASGTSSELTETLGRRFETRADIAEIGLESALGESTELDLTLAAGRVHEIIRDTYDGVSQHAFDGTLDEIGGEARLSIEAWNASTCSIAAGYEIAPTHNPLSSSVLTFEDQRGRFAELRWRSRLERGIQWGASMRHRARDIDAFGSDYDSNALSVHARFARSSAWSADLSWTVRQFDLRAETTKIILDPSPVQVPAVVHYEGSEHALTAGIERQLGQKLRARLAASAALANGDSELRYGALKVDLPWRLDARRTVGLEVDLHRFDGREALESSDYTSFAAVLYAGMSF